MSDTNEVDKKLRDSLSLMIEAGIVEVVEGGYRIAPAFQNYTKAELMAIIEKAAK